MDNEVTASLFTFIQPVVTPLFAFFLLGERVPPLFILGGVLAIMGAYLAGNRKEVVRR
jgi:drug/metabolite transporter (DMT)-like permease